VKTTLNKVLGFAILQTKEFAMKFRTVLAKHKNKLRNNASLKN
jgi:hypothetical protein